VFQNTKKHFFIVDKRTKQTLLTTNKRVSSCRW
jgi:hypothetical protein